MTTDSDNKVTQTRQTGEAQATERQKKEAAAAEWVVRLGAGPLAEDEQAAFEAWCASDAAHCAAFDRALRVWSEVCRLRDLEGPLPASLSSAAIDVTPTLSHRKPEAPLGRRVLALAASLLVAIGIGAFWVNEVTGPEADYVTASAEIERITLSDGSLVDLAPESAIAVDYSGSERLVALLKGEAYFTVAPTADNTARPFTVKAGKLRATALGTRFAVTMYRDGAEVAVAEHSVGIALSGAYRTDSDTVVSEGHALRYRRATGIGPVREASAQTIAAWRRGRLIFDQVPLSDVIAELNRYLRRDIVVLNTSLAGRRVSGIFDADSLDAALEAIAAELDAETTTVPLVGTLLY